MSVQELIVRAKKLHKKQHDNCEKKQALSRIVPLYNAFKANRLVEVKDVNAAVKSIKSVAKGLPKKFDTELPLDSEIFSRLSTRAFQFFFR